MHRLIIALTLVAGLSAHAADLRINGADHIVRCTDIDKLVFDNDVFIVREGFLPCTSVPVDRPPPPPPPPPQTRCVPGPGLVCLPLPGYEKPGEARTPNGTGIRINGTNVYVFRPRSDACATNPPAGQLEIKEANDRKMKRWAITTTPGAVTSDNPLCQGSGWVGRMLFNPNNVAGACQVPLDRPFDHYLSVSCSNCRLFFRVDVFGSCRSVADLAE